MKKIIFLNILLLFFLLQSYQSYSNFNVESNLTQFKQDFYKEKINKSFNKLGYKFKDIPNDIIIDKFELVKLRIDLMLNQKLSENNKFILEYLKYLIGNKIKDISYKNGINNNLDENSNNNIFLVCIGMSNASQECSFWINLVETTIKNNINPNLQIINCAVGSHAIERWNDSQYDNILWDECIEKLNSKGFLDNDTVYVWHKAVKQFLTIKDENGFNEKLISQQDAYNQTLDELSKFTKRLEEKMPFVNTVFISGRSYGGFAKNIQRSEPYSYQNNLAIKNWLNNNKEINGIKYIQGPYFWGDECEENITNDKLCYNRDDYSDDGVHPSMNGRKKITKEIHNYFLKYNWYRK